MLYTNGIYRMEFSMFSSDISLAFLASSQHETWVIMLMLVDWGGRLPKVHLINLEIL